MKQQSSPQCSSKVQYSANTAHYYAVVQITTVQYQSSLKVQYYSSLQCSSIFIYSALSAVLQFTSLQQYSSLGCRRRADYFATVEFTRVQQHSSIQCTIRVHYSAVVHLPTVHKYSSIQCSSTVAAPFPPVNNTEDDSPWQQHWEHLAAH